MPGQTGLIAAQLKLGAPVVVANELVGIYSSSVAGSEPVFCIEMCALSYVVAAGDALGTGYIIVVPLRIAKQPMLTFITPSCERQGVSDPLASVSVSVSVSCPDPMESFGFVPPPLRTANVPRAVNEPSRPTTIKLRRSFLTVLVDTFAYWSICEVRPKADFALRSRFRAVIGIR
jgi:hypothetical protein